MKLTKLALLIFVAALSSTVLAQGSSGADDKKKKWSNAFDSDSEFMKGFETGILLRTKGGKVEEYGCSAPDDADSQVSAAIEMIRSAISSAKDGLPDEPMLHEALALIVEFLGSVQTFVAVLGNAGADMYCAGLVFGNLGSKLLVKFANVLINPVGADGEIVPT